MWLRAALPRHAWPLPALLPGPGSRPPPAGPREEETAVHTGRASDRGEEGVRAAGRAKG